MNKRSGTQNRKTPHSFSNAPGFDQTMKKLNRPIDKMTLFDKHYTVREV